MEWWVSGLMVCVMGMVAACGKAEQGTAVSGKTLCFDYYQRCVNRVFDDTQYYGAMSGSTSTCSASGCHQAGAGPGGALKIHPGLSAIPLSTPEQDRATQIYANFLSAKASANLSSPRQSFLLKKPLLEVFHGGARVFSDDAVLGAREFEFWISRSVDDEFSSQCSTLVTCQP